MGAPYGGFNGPFLLGLIQQNFKSKMKMIIAFATIMGTPIKKETSQLSHAINVHKLYSKERQMETYLENGHI